MGFWLSKGPNLLSLTENLERRGQEREFASDDKQFFSLSNETSWSVVA